MGNGAALSASVLAPILDSTLHSTKRFPGPHCGPVQSDNPVYLPQSSEMPSGYCSASTMPNYRDNSTRAAPISSASETGLSRIARWSCMPTGLAADATMIIGSVGRS